MAVTRMPGKNSALMLAWEQFRETEAFRESLRAGAAAVDPKRVEGAMWAAFVAGFGGAGGHTVEESAQ